MHFSNELLNGHRQSAAYANTCFMSVSLHVTDYKRMWLCISSNSTKKNYTKFTFYLIEHIVFSIREVKKE